MRSESFQILYRVSETLLSMLAYALAAGGGYVFGGEFGALVAGQLLTMLLVSIVLADVRLIQDHYEAE